MQCASRGSSPGARSGQIAFSPAAVSASALGAAVGRRAMAHQEAPRLQAGRGSAHRVERSMPSARASAIWLSPALRSTSTRRPNSPGVSASPASKGGGKIGRTPPTGCGGACSPAATATDLDPRQGAGFVGDGPWLEWLNGDCLGGQTNSVSDLMSFKVRIAQATAPSTFRPAPPSWRRRSTTASATRSAASPATAAPASRTS